MGKGEGKGGEGGEGRAGRGEGGKGRGGREGEGRGKGGEEALLVMWPTKLSALNPPLHVNTHQIQPHMMLHKNVVNFIKNNHKLY